MIDVEFEITTVPEQVDGRAAVDDYELAMLLDHTKAQLDRHIQRALGDSLCDEHQKPPKVKVSGHYDLESEQLDISYNVDTCCKLYLMQCIAALNRR